MSAELRLQCLRNLTDLLSRTFKEQFVFPALGHEDIGVSFSQLAELWQQWLPQEALDTFRTGEYTECRFCPWLLPQLEMGISRGRARERDVS